MAGTCRNNDRYDISRNDCNIFPSAADYVNRLKEQHNTTMFGNKNYYSSSKERLAFSTQTFHTLQFIEKGGGRYKKTAILNNGPGNDCLKWVQSSHENAKRANYYVIKRYNTTPTF
jgi:hypothetical protein